MRLIKPGWISHDGKPIFSIDVHPDGSRVATGGQGESSGKVCIWNMGPIREEKLESDENIPKLLCQMDNHLACVNCVRWSYDGRCLASAGDDKLVMIWQTTRSAVSSSVFGGGGRVVNAESWRVSNTLRGHSGDVLDLAWSVNNTWLATCSVDNTIIVWNANKFPEQITVLRGHTGMVKGVTWDPVGKYLASQSDDKTVRVWRTFDWKLETTVTEPFQQCGGTTHVLRLDWSPDGQYIVTAHAMNNSGPTAQIIERNGWKCGLDYVGHRKAITVARYNAGIMAKKSKKNNEQEMKTLCCAIGSRDRSLSVWMSHMQRPLMVMHDLFTDSILDISWSASGCEMLCCSWDGTVAYFGFTEEEIGRQISQEEKMSELRKLYGKSVLSTGLDVSSQIIESPLVFNMQQQQQQQQSKERSETDQMLGCSEESESESQKKPYKPAPPPACHNSRSMSSSMPPQDRQIESRTKDGRRRITPIFLAPQSEFGDVPLPYTVGGALSQGPVFSSTKETSSILVEKMTDVTSVTELRIRRSSGSQQEAPPTKIRKTDTSETEQRVEPTQSDVHSVRIAAVSSDSHIRDRSDEDSGMKRSHKSGGVVAGVAVPGSPVGERRGELPRDSAKRKDGRGRPRKERAADEPTQQQQQQSEQRPQQQQQQQRHHSDRSTVNGAKEDHTNRTGGVITSSSSSRVNILPAASIDSHFSLQVSMCSSLNSFIANKALKRRTHLISGCSMGGLTGQNSVLSLEIDQHAESVSSHSGLVLPLHRISCLNQGRTVWQTFLPSKPVCATANSLVCCVACSDQTLNVYSTGSGLRHCSPLMLTGVVSQLRSSASFIMALTTTGILSVWNIKSEMCTIHQESTAHLFTGSVKLDNCSLTNQGQPVLTLTNGKSFTYNSNLASWVVVSVNDDVAARCSNHNSCIKSLSADKRLTSGALSVLQSSKPRALMIPYMCMSNKKKDFVDFLYGSSYYCSSSPAHLLIRSDSNEARSSIQALHLSRLSDPVLQCLTTTHLENQLSACLALQSKDEYHHWIITYARYLIQEGLEVKLRDLCSDLIGPSVSVCTTKSTWEPNVLGLKKRDLLKEIVPIMASNIKLQRLFAEYSHLINSAASST